MEGARVSRTIEIETTKVYAVIEGESCSMDCPHLTIHKLVIDDREIKYGDCGFTGNTVGPMFKRECEEKEGR